MENKKKLAVAALAGLLTMGSLGAFASEGSDDSHGCSASGCDQKKEANSCEGKSGCDDKHSCEGKSGCPTADEEGTSE